MQNLIIIRIMLHFCYSQNDNKYSGKRVINNKCGTAGYCGMRNVSLDFVSSLSHAKFFLPKISRLIYCINFGIVICILQNILQVALLSIIILKTYTYWILMFLALSNDSKIIKIRELLLMEKTILQI